MFGHFKHPLSFPAQRHPLSNFTAFGGVAPAFFHLAKGEKAGSETISNDTTTVRGFVCAESVATPIGRVLLPVKHFMGHFDTPLGNAFAGALLAMLAMLGVVLAFERLGV